MVEIQAARTDGAFSVLLGVDTVLPAGSHVLLQGATERPSPSTQADFPSIA